MTTDFTRLPIIDLSPLSEKQPSAATFHHLKRALHDTFRDVGFAYLTSVPLSFTHSDVFELGQSFFDKTLPNKMTLAKQVFDRSHSNTYRGYFPAIPGADNLKEGFEIGPTPAPKRTRPVSGPIDLAEENVFADEAMMAKSAALHNELQSLSRTLLSLLASSLNRRPNDFTSLLDDSVSTLRLLHYPPPPKPQDLACTPHTDSGLLTLLHQDSTGGLEVQNAACEWIAVPYVPGSIVLNIGDLMARLSGGAFVATKHRVKAGGGDRYSVPFFCEPGVDAMVPDEHGERLVRYEDFVLGKMGGWVEFQDDAVNVESEQQPAGMVAVEA